MITLNDLLLATSGQTHGPIHATSFSNFAFDSRLIQPGELFLAVKTERGDGHDYIIEACQKGAAGIIAQQPVELAAYAVTLILVDQTQAALQRWGRYILHKIRTKVIGVTGSTGKTTTKETLAHVLAAHTLHHVFKNPGNWNGRYGLPLALGQLRPEHSLAVLEMASDSLGEIAEMVAMAPPEVAVVTTVQPTHLETFGDPSSLGTCLETIANEKADLVRALPADGIAFLNADDPRVRMMAQETQATVILFGTAPDAHIRASDIEVTLEGAFFNLHLGQVLLRVGESTIGQSLVLTKEGSGAPHPLADKSPSPLPISLPLLGRHAVYFALAAVGVGLHYGMSLDDIIAQLATLKPVPGRLNPLAGKNGSLIIDDSYNASPMAMLAALELLEQLPARRRIAVLGDMPELGEYSAIAHTEVGQRVAQVVDQLVTKGEEARLIAGGAQQAGLEAAQITVAYTTDDVVKAAHEQLAEGDVLLVKGGMMARLERVTARLLANQEDKEQLVRQNEAWQQIITLYFDRPTWIEINLEAIAYNTRHLKALVGQDVTLLAVMKADAYGHGALKVAQTALNNGASWLGVACLPEAQLLRKGGISAPILILGYTPAWQARDSLRYDLRTTIFSLDVARALSKAAVAIGKQARVHIKVDTGMHRLGLFPEQVIGFIREIQDLPNLIIEGLFTHFSVADDANDWYRRYTEQQLQRFKGLLEQLAAEQIDIPIIHAANSAGTLAWRAAHFNMVRPGIALYGIAPSPDIPLPDDFQAALSWKTQIAQVKALSAESYISYGATYRTQKSERIAVIPVGYADGFRRAPNTWGEVLVRGKRAPIVGRVCMDQTMINVTHIPGVRQGDEVVLIGQQADDCITVEEVATQLGTIPYEVISEILARVPRVG